MPQFAIPGQVHTEVAIPEIYEVLTYVHGYGNFALLSPSNLFGPLVSTFKGTIEGSESVTIDKVTHSQIFESARLSETTV